MRRPAKNSISGAGFGRRVFVAGIWSGTARMATRCVSVLSVLVLSRLLSPEAFGLAACSAIVVALSNSVATSGLVQAVIQSNGDVDEVMNFAFWANLAVSFVLFLIILIAAPAGAYLFGEEELVIVIRVQSIQVITDGLAAVQLARTERDIDYRTSARISMMASLSVPTVAIPMAYLGWGYWALVGGSLAGSLVQLIMVAATSPFRPRFAIDWRLAGELARFSAWSTGNAVLAWFFSWGDLFVLGVFGTAGDQGIYRIGKQIVMLVFDVAFSPITRVGLSALSRVQQVSERFIGLFERFARIFGIGGAVVGVGLLVAGGSVFPWLFDTRWEGVGFVVSYLGLSSGLSWVAGSGTGFVYVAMGRPDIPTKLTATIAGYHGPAYLLSVFYGFDAFVITRAALALVGSMLHVMVAVSVLRLRIARYVFDVFTPLAILLPVVLVAGVVRQQTILSTPHADLVSLSAYGIGLAAIAVTYRKDLREVMELIRRLLQPAAGPAPGTDAIARADSPDGHAHR